VEGCGKGFAGIDRGEEGVCGIGVITAILDQQNLISKKTSTKTRMTPPIVRY